MTSRKLVLLIAAACLMANIVVAQTSGPFTQSSQTSQTSSVISQPSLPPSTPDPAIVVASGVDVSDVELRATIHLERSLQRYLLAYEAFKEARKSKKKEVRARMPEFLRNYRESYANFISMLHEDNLYKPQEPPNPAGKYNKKSKQKSGYDMIWPKLDIKHLRDEIKEMVSDGATPDEVIAAINASLPTVNLAKPNIPTTGF